MTVLTTSQFLYTCTLEQGGSPFAENKEKAVVSAAPGNETVRS